MQIADRLLPWLTSRRRLQQQAGLQVSSSAPGISVANTSLPGKGGCIEARCEGHAIQRVCKIAACSPRKTHVGREPCRFDELVQICADSDRQLAGARPYLVIAAGHICLERAYIRGRRREANPLRCPPDRGPASRQRLVQAEHCIVAILLPAVRIGRMLASEFTLRWRLNWGGSLLSMRRAGGGQQAGGNQSDA
jgi:hypothetical protein